MQKIRIIRFFFLNSVHWQLEVEKKTSQMTLRLHIYLRTNKTLIHISLYAFDSCGKNLIHKKM